MSVSSTHVIQAVGQTNLTAATRYYPDSDGMQIQSASELVLAMICSGGVTVTVEHAAMTPDDTAPAAGDWQDVTAKAVALVGSAGSSYVDTTAEIAIVLPRGRVRIKYVTSDGSNSVRLSYSVRHLTDSAVSHAGLLAGIQSTGATAAKQDTGNTSLATLQPCTRSADADGAITKSDTTEYSPPLRAIWATGAGNLTLMLSGDSSNVVTIPVAANEKITFLSIKKVMAATTATGISGVA